VEPNPQFILTAHARTVLKERGVDPAWVERVLLNPQKTEADKYDVRLRHALGHIPERDDRVLRVVYNPSQQPWTVVTVYFDRAQRGKI
jgi:hypothetical protein